MNSALMPPAIVNSTMHDKDFDAARCEEKLTIRQNYASPGTTIWSGRSEGGIESRLSFADYQDLSLRAIVIRTSGSAYVGVLISQVISDPSSVSICSPNSGPVVKHDQRKKDQLVAKKFSTLVAGGLMLYRCKDCKLYLDLRSAAIAHIQSTLSYGSSKRFIRNSDTSLDRLPRVPFAIIKDSVDYNSLKIT